MAEDAGYISEDAEPVRPIVIDNGTGLVKAGYAGEDAPSHVFPAVVGRTPNPENKPGLGGKTYLGTDATDHRGILDLCCPVERGVITDFDSMELIWKYTIENRMKQSIEDHPVLLTEPPLNTVASKKATAEIFFEKFNCPALYLACTAALTLFSVGKKTGLALTSGDGCTFCTPIYDGGVISQAVSRVDIGGRDLTNYLSTLLGDRGYSFMSKKGGLKIVRKMKETLAYVANDYATEKEGKEDIKEFELPDGKKVKVGRERLMCAEPLFDPSILGVRQAGMHEQAITSINKCPIDVRSSMYENVVIGGGSTLLPNFQKRLETELKKLAPEKANIKILLPADRRYSAWIGGSMLASYDTFADQYVSRAEYKEQGGDVVVKKCPL